MKIILTSRSILILQQQPSSSEERKSTRPTTVNLPTATGRIPNRDLPPTGIKVESTHVGPIIHVHDVRVITQHRLTNIQSEIMSIISSIDKPIVSTKSAKSKKSWRKLVRGTSN